MKIININVVQVLSVDFCLSVSCVALLGEYIYLAEMTLQVNFFDCVIYSLIMIPRLFSLGKRLYNRG